MRLVLFCLLFFGVQMYARLETLCQMMVDQMMVDGQGGEVLLISLNTSINLDQYPIKKIKFDPLLY